MCHGVTPTTPLMPDNMIIEMFMKGRTHLPVVFSQQHFISKMGSRHTLKAFMKERNHLTVTFYLKIGLKHHIESVHEGEKLLVLCALQHFLQNNI